MYSAIAQNKRRTVFVIAIFIAICLGLAYWAWSLTHLMWIPTFFMVFIVTYTCIQYFLAGRIAMRLAGGVEVKSKADNPKLWKIVENLAISQGMPMPRIFIIEDDSMNAFATGRDPKHAMVAATRGLMTTLEKYELEGVMAHEIAHVKNYDIRVKTIIFGLVGAISALAQFFYYFAIGSFNGTRYSRRDDSSAAVAQLIGALALIVAAVLAIVAFVIGPIVTAAVSRQREYLADATGALITRHPEGLIAALIKLETSFAPTSGRSKGNALMYFNNPLRRFFWSQLTSSHPPTEKRVERLQNMATAF